MQRIYSIKDNVMGFERLFTCPNDGMALRLFADTCKQEGNQISDHPEDFSIWRMGELDSEKGITAEEPYFLDKAVNYVKPKNN